MGIVEGVSIVVATMLLAATPAVAQDVSPQDANAADAETGSIDGDIIVTARRRDETSLSIPVAVTALSGEQLERMSVTTLADLASLVPALKVGEVAGGVGGTIVLRGVGTTAGSNPSFEQTVSVNLDGAQISRGSVLRLGQIDMERIEILKGPQALFFGKNSPAGVISIRTADPGDEFELIARSGYEFNADEIRGDLVLSTPVTQTLGIRVALSASNIQGYRTSLVGNAIAAANAIRPGAVTGFEERGPKQTFAFGRATFKWDPTDTFDARGKFTYSRVDGFGYQQGGNFQRVYCPNGTAALGAQATALNGGVPNPALAAALAVDDCTADDRFANGNINPTVIAAAGGRFDDVRGAAEYTQALGSLEMNYRPTETLMLTSVSAYVRQTEFRYDTYAAAPSDAVTAVDIAGDTAYRQISQELRLASAFDGPLNFLMGGYVEDSKLRTNTFAILNPAIFDQNVEGEAYSSFAQATWDMTDRLELAGGARVTREIRNIAITRNGVPQPVSRTTARFDNLSPEATLTWRPNTDTTLYSAYKNGFKSGGFATPLTGGVPLVAPGPDYLYRPEQAEGFEIGAKARLLDGILRINTAAYSFEYSDLQVNSLDNSSGLPVIRVTNAAAARVRGIEADFVLRPRTLTGFDLHGAVNYNHATYTDFLATCYIGQTAAAGCNVNPNAAGVFQGQQLAGQPLINAPRWNASVGFNYMRPVATNGMSLGASFDASYKSGYNPHPERAPGAEQRPVWFLSGSLRAYHDDSGWQVALIGRNLTEQYRVDVASNVPQTGIGARTGTTLVGGLADLSGNVNRGREILLELTLRPAKWLR